MPLVIFQHILEERGKLLMWHATESLDDLRRKYWKIYTNTPIPDIKLEKREREYIVGRLLLHLVLPNQQCSHLANGKPIVTGGWHISFSHTEDWVALAVADAPVGIDIQGPDEKLLRIAPKFCSAHELAWLEGLPQPMEGALTIWSAKEAVFKVYGENIEFAEEMSAHLQHPSQSHFDVMYNGDHGEAHFRMHQMQHRHLRIVYTMLPD
jgi:4'-phosphopantetheinyl transferase